MHMNEWSLRMKITILILVFAASLAIGSSFAKGSLGYECVTDTSFHNFTFGESTYNTTMPCQFGCDNYTGLCKDTPLESGGMPIVFVLSSLMVAFFIIAAVGTFGGKDDDVSTGMATKEGRNATRGYWWVLRYMFIVFGLYMGQADAATMSQMLKASSQTTLQGIMDAVYGFFVFSGIFMTWIFAAIILMMLFDHIMAVIRWFGKRRNE